MPLFNKFFLPIVQEVVFHDIFDVLWYIIPSVSTVMTIGALMIGGYVSRKLYITRKIDPEEIMRRHRFLRGIHTFLLNRCCINALYYKIAYSVIGLSRTLYRNVEMEGISRPKIRGINEFFNLAISWIISLSRKTYSSIELGGFEKFNQKVAENVTKFSERLRLTQTGVLSHNMLLMLLGMVMLLVLLLIFGQGHLR